jgi:hypothetical protein
LAEFDLLRHSRNDIRDRKWAQPAYREATIKYLTLCRAREELQRLDVEVRRLFTAIDAETKDTEATILKLEQTCLTLAAELRRRWQKRSAINAIHQHHLKRIAELPGFTGVLSIGTRVCSIATPHPANPTPSVASIPHPLSAPASQPTNIPKPTLNPSEPHLLSSNGATTSIETRNYLAARLPELYIQHPEFTTTIPEFVRGPPWQPNHATIDPSSFYGEPDSDEIEADLVNMTEFICLID